METAAFHGLCPVSGNDKIMPPFEKHSKIMPPV
jgi:hypothetical protein